LLLNSCLHCCSSIYFFIAFVVILSAPLNSCKKDTVALNDTTDSIVDSTLIKDTTTLFNDSLKTSWNFKFDNQYFIQSDFTSPMRANFNSNVEARITTGSGRRFKSNLSLKNLDGTYRKNKTKGIFVEPQDNRLRAEHQLLQ
jgi:hypothetical protein